MRLTEAKSSYKGRVYVKGSGEEREIGLTQGELRAMRSKLGCV